MLSNIIKQNDNFIDGNYVTILTPTAWQYIYGDSVSPTWESFPGATLYRIQLEIYGGALVEEKTTSFENLTVTFNSITDGQYTIKVRAEKGSRYTDWSTVNFEIENLTAPSYMLPKERADVQAYGGLPYLVSIEASALGWAEKYQQQCATDAAFSEIVDDSEYITSPFDVILNAYDTYYLRIRGYNGSVYGPWSITRSFNLIPDGD